MARATPSEAEDPVTAFYEAWRARQSRPDACKLSEARRALIAKRAKRADATADDLRALVRYAYEADTQEARWWQDHPQYLGIEYLLRDEKLPGRIERAREWATESGDAESRDVEPDEGGDLARFRRLDPAPDAAPVEPPASARTVVHRRRAK